MAEKSVSIFTPLIYVSVLLTALVFFSKYHHAKKLQKLSETPQFYEFNFPRDIYYELKEQEKVPPKLLKAALLSWISEDISRTLLFQQYAQPMANLLQNGLIDEQINEQFIGSLKLTNHEAMEAVGECKTYPGFDIAPLSAKEIALQSAVHKRVEQLDILQNNYHEIVGDNLPEEEINLDGIVLPSLS